MSKFISDKLKSLFKSSPVTSAITAEAMPKTSTILSAAQKLTAPIKPHTPLIRFRKDSTAAVSASSQKSAPGPAAGQRAPPPPGVKQGLRIALPTIEDWQLPQRYRRRPLDTEEIEYINRGGPA